MTETLHYLVSRGADNLSSVEASLLYTLLSLVLFSICLTAGLIFLRRYRNARKDVLPRYEEEHPPRRESIQKRLSDFVRGSTDKTEVFIVSEKHCIDSEPSTPSTPTSPSEVPEIRVTFPEEVDTSGKRQSGRVVVVHMAEKGGLGMEPVDENLPPYQKDASDRFHSIDMERIGGLKEKDSPA